MMNLSVRDTRALCLLLIVIGLCLGIADSREVSSLTIDNLKKIRQSMDSVYYFVVVNMEIKSQLLSQLSQESLLNENVKVKLYESDCSEKLLVACQKNQNIPIILFYNKGAISYSRYTASTFKQVNDIVEWMISIIRTGPLNIGNQLQIQRLIHEKQEIFVMLEDKSKRQEHSAYQLLAKEFPFIKFVYIQSEELGRKLELTQGNLTYYHGQLLNENRRVYNHPPRLDIWKKFVFECYLDHIKNVDNELPSSRFPFKNYEGLLLLWDNSMRCQVMWQQLMGWKNEGQLLQKFRGLQLMKFTIREEQIKLIELLQIYYHIKILKNAEMPLALYIRNDESQKMPFRVMRNISLQSNIIDQLQLFMTDINANELGNYVLDKGVLKKNGFYGKGSEKLIQKLSFTTYRKAINQAIHASKYYIVFVTAFDFDCSKCQQFYTDYKKLASYMSTQREDIVFGVINLSENQVDEPRIGNIPDLILYKAKSGQVVRSLKRFAFEGIMDFISENAPKIQGDEL